MKVVKNEAPKEEAKVADIPYEVVVEECPFTEEIDYLREGISWLACDIIEHERALDLIGDRLADLELASFGADWQWGLVRKVGFLEEGAITDAENLSGVIDVLSNLQQANKLMLDLIITHNDEIKGLQEQHEEFQRQRWIFSIIIWVILIWIWVANYVL